MCRLRAQDPAALRSLRTPSVEQSRLLLDHLRPQTVRFLLCRLRVLVGVVQYHLCPHFLTCLPLRQLHPLQLAIFLLSVLSRTCVPGMAFPAIKTWAQATAWEALARKGQHPLTPPVGLQPGALLLDLALWYIGRFLLQELLLGVGFQRRLGAGLLQKQGLEAPEGIPVLFLLQRLPMVNTYADRLKQLRAGQDGVAAP